MDVALGKVNWPMHPCHADQKQDNSSSNIDPMNRWLYPKSHTLQQKSVFPASQKFREKSKKTGGGWGINPSSIFFLV